MTETADPALVQQVVQAAEKMSKAFRSWQYFRSDECEDRMFAAVRAYEDAMHRVY